MQNKNEGKELKCAGFDQKQQEQKRIDKIETIYAKQKFRINTIVLTRTASLDIISGGGYNELAAGGAVLQGGKAAFYIGEADEEK